jgi:hypothetical protein
MPGKNGDTVRSRIRAWWEKEDTGTAMAGCLGWQGRLGRQKLTKEYLAGPSVSMLTRVAGIIKDGGDLP